MRSTRRRWITQAAAGAAAASVVRPAAVAATRGAPPLPPPLPAEVFRERQAKLKAAARANGLDAVLVTPSTNLAYIANLTMGRSERLTALLLFADGPSVVVTPYFEEGVVRREVATDDLKTWTEEQDPIPLVVKSLGKSRRIGVEGSTDYATVARLEAAAEGAKLEDATPLFDGMRTVKSDAEMALIRDAGNRTVTAIEATHKRLRRGMTEREVSGILEEEFRKLLVRGGGLVQFGPSAALPHGSPGNRELARGDVVLIDAGCRVRGYTADVTRTVSFGPPPDEVRKVYAAVDRAQIAGIEALKAGATGEAVDRAARKVIEDAGYGKYFTHRLGHGVGMDGHEHPYLVQGNTKPLVAGNTVTVEPGIYLPDKFGVRIEDDYGVRQGNPVSLSVRPWELAVVG
ncbi:MAG: M24 family metallopeptidase [Thermoanaerobaculia bacterium]